MPAIGITGGISTGKSTFCECLREVLQGAKFFNADEAAKSDIDIGVRAYYRHCQANWKHS